MNAPKLHPLRWAACMVVAWLYHLGTAHAGSHDFRPTQALSAYGQECAACHVAYPPALLPADAWLRIMAGLSRHYGADASLDAAQVQHIGAWLTRHAGTYKKVRAAPPEDRITRADWFVREHKKVLPATNGQGARSSAQCQHCHAQADLGLFNEPPERILALTRRRP